jgi:ribokinase
MTGIVITGYASLDYCVQLDRAPRPDATATVLSRPLEWPRLGGSPAYVASSLAAAGVREVRAISWVGADADGREYAKSLSLRGVRVDGIGVRPGRTPICILAYQPDGGCHCFYDPSLSGPLVLDASQEALVARAEWVCLTIGPPEATRQALAAASPGAKIIWAVKADPRSMPSELAAMIAARADIIACSRGEAGFVADALAACRAPARGRLLLETRGSDGVFLRAGEVEEIIGVEALAADDTTGAGDTFLGGFLASLMAAPDLPSEAVKAGAKAAREMLTARTEATKGIGR